MSSPTKSANLGSNNPQTSEPNQSSRPPRRPNQNRNDANVQFSHQAFANSTIPMPYNPNPPYYPVGFSGYNGYIPDYGYAPFPAHGNRNQYANYYPNQKHMKNYNGKNYNNVKPPYNQSGIPNNSGYQSPGNLSGVTSPALANSALTSPTSGGSPFKSPVTPVKSVIGSPVKISIKNNQGEEVDLKQLKHPNSQSAPEKPVDNEKKSAVILDFKARIAAIAAQKKKTAQPAKKKQEEEEAAKKAADEKAAAEKVAIEKDAAEKEAAAKAAAEKEAAEKAAAEKEAAEKAAAEKEAAAAKAAAEKEAAEKEAAEKEAAEIAAAEAAATESAKSIEEVASEHASEDEESDDSHFTITELCEAISKAQPVSNPFTFKYAEGFSAPDERCKQFFEKTGKMKYDPRFLLQFKDKLRLEVDDEWKRKHMSLIDIGSGSHGGSMRSNSNFRGSSGGFGMGSNIGNARGGPMGSNFRSQSGGMRKGFGGDSRSGSRQSSKRKGGSNASGSKRDGRSDSKRSGSKRFNDSKNSENDELRDKDGNIIPPEPIKPLEKSATRWVPRTLKKASGQVEVKKNPDGTDHLEPEEVKSKTNSLLNKLTLEMFDKISDEIIEVACQSRFEKDASTLKQVLELTFHKACDEPHWSMMYAQFCAKIVTSYPDDIVDETQEKSTGGFQNGGFLVRKCLLSRCQMEFEKGWTNDLPNEQDVVMLSDEYYAAAAAKRRGLGLVKFIGELYILGLVSDLVIIKCLRSSLANAKKDPTEENIETFAELIKTIGPVIDQTKSPKSPQIKGEFGKAMEAMEVLSKNKSTPARARFKLLDTLDLRKNKWNDGTNAGPKTISEIHAEAERQQREEEKKKNDRRGGKKQYGNDSRQYSNSNWGQKTVSKNDMKNIGFVRNSSEKSSGPTNNFLKHSSHSQGSGNSTRENSNRIGNASTNSSSSTVAEQAKVNQFDLLNNDDDDDATEEHAGEKLNS